MDTAGDGGEDRARATAKQFLWIMPVLWHGVGNEMRVAGEEHGIVTMAQMRAMGLLGEWQSRGRACTLNDLSHGHEVSPATMSRMVSTLVERGWVQREPDPQDRRQVAISLTPSGLAIWSEIIGRSVDHLSHTFDDLTDDELDGLQTALTALTRVVNERRRQVRCHHDEKAERTA